MTKDISTAEPGLFQQVFYGTKPDDPKLYTRAASYYFPNSPRTFNILKIPVHAVVVQAISSPVANAVGVLSNVTADVTYYIYPNGKIYVHSVLQVAAAQTASEWRCATLGLSDPTSGDPYSGPDSTGWIRSSTTQNPYSSVSAPESYIFAYWRASTTPAPYTNFTKASVLLVPRPGNPNQGQQGRHNWGGWKRWYYGNVSLNLSARTEPGPGLPDTTRHSGEFRASEYQQQCRGEPHCPGVLRRSDATACARPRRHSPPRAASSMFH